MAALAAGLELEYDEQGQDPWERSPFRWIRQQASRRRGKIGEQLLSGLLAARDFAIGPSGDSQSDRRVNGKAVEIKFSTLWQSGIYKFQQIRDQQYDLLVCLGMSPFNAHGWAIPKRALHQHVFGKGMGQHTGAAGAETAWLSFTPDAPYPWMTAYGGSLGEMIRVLRRLTV